MAFWQTLRNEYSEIKNKRFGNKLICDFVKKRLEHFDFSREVTESFNDEQLFDIDKTYMYELEEFLAEKSRNRLAILEESIEVLEMIKEN